MHYFEFHFQKIIAATKGWKDDEFGAYVRLLIEQFDRGFIPDDSTELSRLITTYKKNWPLLKKKFAEPSEPGQLRNTFMCTVRAQAHGKSAVNSENGKKGVDAKRRKKSERLANGEAVEDQTDQRGLSQPVTSNHKPKEEKKVKKKTVMAEEWDYNPSEDTPVELTELEIGGTIEWVAALRRVAISTERVLELWKAFKFKLTGTKFYQDRGELVQHFRNWVKDEDLEIKSLSGTKSMVL